MGRYLHEAAHHLTSHLTNERRSCRGDLWPNTGNVHQAHQVLTASCAAQEEVNPGMYIHDAPLVRQCPQLLDHFHAPKYFPNDIKELESRTGIPSNALGFMYHPSLFVGKKGSGSPLHSDADMTRFWLLVMTGSKHVRLISPSENWRSDTRDKRTFQPLIFGVNLMSPDFKRHPQMDGMLVYDTVVKAGELLFIPAGWAHQVRRLGLLSVRLSVRLLSVRLSVHALLRPWQLVGTTELWLTFKLMCCCMHSWDRRTCLQRQPVPSIQPCPTAAAKPHTHTRRQVQFLNTGSIAGNQPGGHGGHEPELCGHGRRTALCSRTGGGHAQTDPGEEPSYGVPHV